MSFKMCIQYFNNQLTIKKMWKQFLLLLRRPFTPEAINSSINHKNFMKYKFGPVLVDKERCMLLIHSLKEERKLYFYK